MPAPDPKAVLESGKRFLPSSIADNVFVKALLAGAATIALIAATPAFAPIGAIGATGWLVVYVVTGGTLSSEVVKRAWLAWQDMEDPKRAEYDHKLELLKKLRDEGTLSDEEYREQAQELLRSVMG